MATRLVFSEEDMTVDEGLGYPKAYAKLCRDSHLNPYCNAPPSTFIPYVLPDHEASRARELDDMFPITDPEAKPSTKPTIYSGLLWKQLDHLGNAGFDPAKFRVDPYGNVLYYLADAASPLAWEIDHWFPCSRGGRTVPSNLRILQLQVCRKKHNKLEFLVPWWDLQLGISVNQFLSVFASSNLDFRNRAFSLLFSEGENEELNSSQTVDSHAFPQHFMETSKHVGIAPAAIVLSRKPSSDASLALQSIDLNRRFRPSSPATATRKLLADDNESVCKSIQRYKPSISKENDNPNMVTNPYMAISMARDSLRQREETEKMQSEMQKLDEELDEMKKKNEDERLAIQELELLLIKRRRRVEKCRRLAESQSSYKALLEKMIRDAMHQSVIYKEQVRLNQSANNSLMARLEAQRAICDSSEKELHKKFKQRDELETQIRPQWEQARKRSRMDDTLYAERDDKSILYLPETRARKPSKKELRVFLEEEHKASKAGLSLNEEGKQEELEEGKVEFESNTDRENPEEHNKSLDAVDNESPIENKLHNLEIQEPNERKILKGSVLRSPIQEEDEEDRKQLGKGNVEKWLQMLLDNTEEGDSVNLPTVNAYECEASRTGEIIRKLNHKNPQKEVKVLKFPTSENKQIGLQTLQERKGGTRRSHIVDMESNEIKLENTSKFEVSIGKGVGSSKIFEDNERKDREVRKEKGGRSESARPVRPSSPSVILGMRKGVDCIRKKPVVVGSDEDAEEALFNESARPVRPSSPSVILGMRKGVDCIRKKPVVVGSDEDAEEALFNESARPVRPSSPSVILGMRKGVDCIRKKPVVVGNEKEALFNENNFIKSAMKTIKKGVKI
ncbi:PREDICTED: uncharacterized protein LOC104592328 [Nelumbo nucifera]|uniref:Titin homolog n=2 Tax=Nelumbo nucifera TaxID=4432 RepID=A0A822ZSJ3_NELNU|nr:PREDICTED: uncharacterized protein LOC104592328 [Nelumbo nucifera]DAD44818.1 TPA_asm: hypothetical protein HUJ06_003048 [Nelumbo nucifera]